MERQKRVLNLLILNTVIIPIAIMAIGYIYWEHSMYIFVAIAIALLWIRIVGKKYVDKLNKEKENNTQK